MQIRILPFGILKESLGSAPFVLDLPGGATVADLIARLGVQAPAVETLGIAVSVNAEYAERLHVLRENDEVGLLPPVSGGAPPNEPAKTEDCVLIRLVREPIEAEASSLPRSKAKTAPSLFLTASSATTPAAVRPSTSTTRLTKRWPLSR